MCLCLCIWSEHRQSEGMTFAQIKYICRLPSFHMLKNEFGSHFILQSGLAAKLQDIRNKTPSENILLYWYFYLFMWVYVIIFVFRSISLSILNALSSIPTHPRHFFFLSLLCLLRKEAEEENWMARSGEMSRAAGSMFSWDRKRAADVEWRWEKTGKTCKQCVWTGEKKDTERKIYFGGSKGKWWSKRKRAKKKQRVGRVCAAGIIFPHSSYCHT